MTTPITDVNSISVISDVELLESGGLTGSGTLTGTEIIPVTTTGFFQTTLTAIANFVLGKRDLADYPNLRTYAGVVTRVYLNGNPNIAGFFAVNPSDTTSPDNGGTIIIDALGRRWYRQYIDRVYAHWFTVGPSYITNSASLNAAYAVCLQGGTIPKLPLYANGVTITSPVVFSGGDNLTNNADLGCNLDITLLNVTIPPGTGTAITICNARKPRWRISINGSGTEHNQVDTSTPPQVILSGTDIAVSHYNVEGAVFDLQGYNFRGILSYYNGANGKWLENKYGNILARTCFQTVNWTGNTSTGQAAVGVINSIWEVIPWFRSQVSWLGDLNIHHIENSDVNTFQIAGPSWDFSHVGSLHLGKVNLGNNAQYMLSISSASSLVDIDQLYLLGNGTVANSKSNGDSTTIGCNFTDVSYLSIANLIASQCSTGMLVSGGTRMSIGAFGGKNNTFDVGLQLGGSSNTSVDVDIANYHSEGVYNGSIQYRYNLQGRMSIGRGYIRSGNVPASATNPAIDLSGVSASFFFTPNDLTIDNSWTVGVNHYYLGSVLAGEGNQVACGTPLIDSFGHKGAADLKTFVMPLPTAQPVFGTTYTNTLPYAMLLYVPVSFGSASVAGDYAAVKLTDPYGTVYDLAARVSVNMAALPDIKTLGPILVGPGWSFVISVVSSATNRTALQSSQNPYWIRA